MKRTTLLLLAATAGGALLGLHARRSSPGEPVVLGPDAARRLYDRLAPVYDRAATAYGLVGGARYRRRAVEALCLAPGDRAVDLCCGTGANLPLLVEAVGPTGRVVGVDLSPGMLAQARQRVGTAGWQNVDLIAADVWDFTFPEPVHGVLSTFGIEMVPEHDNVIARAMDALTSSGQIAVGGLRRPDGGPEWLIRAGEIINHPFGVSRAYEHIQPWRSVETHSKGIHYEEYLLGAAYLAIGLAPDPS